MSADTVVVGAVVLGAVAFLLRRVILARRASRHGAAGCDRCGH
jgi:hypothetical protein